MVSSLTLIFRQPIRTPSTSSTSWKEVHGHNRNDRNWAINFTWPKKLHNQGE